MKQYFTFFFALFLSAQLTAQSGAKKYLLLEHFTNTVCPICSSQNPGFYETIEPYAEDIHHISYHPPVPYSSCAIYQSNPEENATRGNYYSIFGTPKVFFNGLNGSSAGQVDEQDIESNLNLTSPLAISVEESGTTNRTVKVEVVSFDTPPDGDLRIFVAAVEKEYMYDAPNGEEIHHDVFRKMLTDIAGDPVTPAAVNGSVSLNYSFTVDNTWESDQIYVLAFIQDAATKEVFNSGTRFDPPVVFTTTEDLPKTAFEVFPNPVSGQTNLVFQEDISGEVRLRNTLGQLVLQQTLENIRNTVLETSNLQKGTYMLEILVEENNAKSVKRGVEKLVKLD